ncbi:MAG: hypothetical protein V3W11_04340 [bacterium]
MTPIEVIIRKALLDRDVKRGVRGLAQKIKCAESYVYDVVKGRRGARGRRAKVIKRRIAKFLKIPYDELWNGDGSSGKGGRRCA